MRKSRDCLQTEASLVARAMAEPSSADAGFDVGAHLSTCSQCRLFAEGISTARQLFDFAPLYSESLRNSTLHAVTGRQKARILPLFLWLVPCSFMGLLFGVIGPFVLLSRMMQVIITSQFLATLITISIFSTLAICTTGVVLTLFIRSRQNGVVAADMWCLAREV